MRIIYLHQYFNLPSDSGGTRSYEMAKRLVAAGHKVFIITSDRNARKGAKGWRVTKEDGIEVHRLPVPYSNKMSFFQRMGSFVKFAIGASCRAASIEADVVFATSTPLTIAVPGVYSSKRQGIPMVFEVRDLWPELPIAVGALKGPLIPLAHCLERFAYKNSSRIVALSQGMKEGVVKSGFSADKVHIIPNSSDVDFFDVPQQAGIEFRNKYEWLQDKPLVLYAGTLGLINGVSYLANLAKEVISLEPEIRFLVVGDGAEKEKVKRVAKGLGVYGKNFFMMNPVPKSSMPSVFSAATVSISLFIDLPEMWANSANKFFDSLASSTPVAINYSGWQAELLVKTGAGIVLSANDMELSARCLVDLLGDGSRLQKSAHSARTLAIEKFNRDKLAQELEEVLLSVVDTRP